MAIDPALFGDSRDPYLGIEVSERVPVPGLESIVLQEAWTEPTDVASYDEATGDLVGRKPAPVYRCAFCGTTTTRRVPVALEVERAVDGARDNRMLMQYVAECVACWKAQW